jgi:hypothetical protein
MPDYEFCCFVQGGTQPFPVIASSGAYICNLKQAIKKERDISLKEFGAVNLSLWKVRCFWRLDLTLRVT